MDTPPTFSLADGPLPPVPASPEQTPEVQAVVADTQAAVAAVVQDAQDTAPAADPVTAPGQPLRLVRQDAAPEAAANPVVAAPVTEEDPSLTRSITLAPAEERLAAMQLKDTEEEAAEAAETASDIPGNAEAIGKVLSGLQEQVNTLNETIGALQAAGPSPVHAALAAQPTVTPEELATERTRIAGLEQSLAELRTYAQGTEAIRADAVQLEAKLAAAEARIAALEATPRLTADELRAAVAALPTAITPEQVSDAIREALTGPELQRALPAALSKMVEEGRMGTSFYFESPPEPPQVDQAAA